MLGFTRYLASGAVLIALTAVGWGWTQSLRADAIAQRLDQLTVELDQSRAAMRAASEAIKAQIAEERRIARQGAAIKEEIDNAPDQDRPAPDWLRALPGWLRIDVGSSLGSAADPDGPGAAAGMQDRNYR